MQPQRILVVVSLLAGVVADVTATQQIIPSALLIVDQNRSTVIERIVGEWGERLASSSAGISPAQLREILGGLRADGVLAASLAGTLDGLRDVVATSMTSTAPLQPGRVSPMSLGDTNVDLAYTPITPCRILDTRNGTAPPYNSVMVGGAAFPVTANLANFAPQGGSATSCGLPSSFQAIAVTFTVLNPNFDAFLAASNTSNFATLTQSVVMDFSANRGLANTGIVPVDNTVKFYLGLPSQVSTHVIADAVGYFKRPGNYFGTITVQGGGATVNGGANNTAGNEFATVGGGDGNTASGLTSTVAGGVGNIASGASSTVGGGGGNIASGPVATVPGGENNLAGGLGSFAAGFRAKVYVDGSFVFSDSTDADFYSGIANEFIVGATGGIGMYTAKNYSTGCHIPPAGGSWACTSSRDVKRDFARLDARTVLNKVAALPLSTWRYVNEAAEIRHAGPMAQDFRAAFGLGDDDRTISTVDAEGIALAAIQGLHQVMQQKDREIAQLRRKLQAIEAKLGL